VEHDGEVYSCDHFVYPEYRLGNIAETHLGDMAFSAEQEKFGMDKRDTLPKQCRECDYLQLCWGECPKNRLIKTKDGETQLNYLCSGLYRFYEHIGPDVIRILKHLGACPSRLFFRFQSLILAAPLGKSYASLFSCQPRANYFLGPDPVRY
jgi:uncharacterized protein